MEQRQMLRTILVYLLDNVVAILENPSLECTNAEYRLVRAIRIYVEEIS